VLLKNLKQRNLFYQLFSLRFLKKYLKKSLLPLLLKANGLGRFGCQTVQFGTNFGMNENINQIYEGHLL